LEDSNILDHSEIDEMLLYKYYDNCNQISIFDGFENKEGYIREAYKKQNILIGYKIKEGYEKID